MMNLAPVALPLLLLAACGQADDAVVIVEREVVVDQPAPEQVVAVENPPPTIEVVGTPPEDGAPSISPEPTPVAAPDVELKCLIGDVDPASDPNFARIPQEYLGGSRVWGHKDAVAALTRMADAATADGVSLKAVSAFRSFSDQKRIWEDKWTGRTLVEGGKLPDTVPDPAARARKILEFSSMPGTSRHHWGTDFDLNNLSNAYFASGEGKRTYDWLVANAADHGFCQVYSPKSAERPTGYEEERWHWSFLPVASAYLAQYPSVVGYDHIKGFAGSEAAQPIDVIGNYVQGISPSCRP